MSHKIEQVKRLLQESLAKINTLEKQINNLIQAYTQVMLHGGADPDQLIDDLYFLLTYEVPGEPSPMVRETIQAIVRAIQEIQQEDH
jgi:hypothetical protein